MLDRELYVTTDLFEVTTPKPHFINPRCFGEDFAEWLRPRLAGAGVEVDVPVQEDWGWALLARAGGRTFTISLGVSDESIGEVPAEWRVGLSYEKMLNGLGSWLRPAPTEQFEQLFGRLRAVLESEPRFRFSETEST